MKHESKRQTFENRQTISHRYNPPPLALPTLCCILPEFMDHRVSMRCAMCNDTVVLKWR